MLLAGLAWVVMILLVARVGWRDGRYSHWHPFRRFTREELERDLRQGGEQ